MSKIKYVKYDNIDQINFANLEDKMIDDVCVILGVINDQYFFRLTKVSHDFNEGKFAFVSINNSSCYYHGWGTLKSQINTFMEQLPGDNSEILVFSDLQNYLEYLLEGVRQNPNKKAYKGMLNLIEMITNQKDLDDSLKLSSISELMRGFHLNE